MENELYIKTLSFGEYGYGYPEETYSYKFKDEQGHISYSLYGNGTSPKIKIKNTDKFAGNILEILKSWKHKYYWKYTICDGTMWYLNIKLSNGKYIRYEGHEKYPDNYKKLKGYLNRFVGKYRKQLENSYLKGA